MSQRNRNWSQYFVVQLDGHVRELESNGENLLYFMDIRNGNLKRKVKLSLKGNGPGCDMQQAFEMASHILCYCEVPVLLRFRHLNHHFWKPCAFADISISRVLDLVSVGLLNA